MESSVAAERVVYVLAAPFTTITDDIPFDKLREFFTPDKQSASSELPVERIAIATDNSDAFTFLFGGNAKEAVVSPENLPETIDQSLRNNTWLILPFDQLEPRLKLITIEGMNPFSKQFDPADWPMTIRISDQQLTEAEWEYAPVTNRDPDKLTSLMLTGVTALVRGTASYMYVWGPEYPASNIHETLREADILHVNNEVPFAPVCQQTESQLANLIFCSQTSAMDLLTYIGTDVVELDGDHFQDFGDEAVLYTLDLYDQHEIPYYGGGRNIEEAQRPLVLEHNGNKFAFIGCNAKEIGYSAASETRPGAVHCDIPLIVEQIKELKSLWYIPIVTFQHIEYYNVSPNQHMMDDFKAVADAGAVIVSGSQSHIPMAFDISKNAFIHYGLGNLFFDQAFFLPETSEATIDRHIFYNGRHLGTEILTIKFTNLALNRFMTESERTPVLERIFRESILERQH